MIIPVKATTTYNWIQNSGFDDSGGELLVNGGFETGTAYGWTNSSISIGGGAYDGLYCAEFSFNDYINQTFSPVLMSSITFSFWYKLDAGYLKYGVYYNDSSIFEEQLTGYPLDWTFKNVTVNPTKFIIRIRFLCNTGGDFNIQAKVDKVTINVSGSGQATISPTTMPWFTNVAIGTHYPQIVDDTSNTVPNSCLFQRGTQVYDALMQVISNLASDSVTSFTLYALDASGYGNATLDVKIRYTDGSWSSSAPTAISHSWAQYNFTYLIVPHKIIDEVFIKPSDYTGSAVYVDTVSLLSTSPITAVSFSFDLSPSALWINSYPSGYRLMGFGSYENQAYTATCIMYNNSVPTGNGTFLVTSSLASYSGNITNGIFSFNIAKRSIPVNNTHELFNININSNLYNTSVVISAWWYKLSSEVPAYETSTEKTNQFIDAFPIILIMAIFIIPATCYLGVGGFVGGFSVASIVCVWTGIAPPWFIAVTVLTDIVMIFFATRQKNTASET